MNKTELVAAAAEKAGLTQKDTDKALGAIVDVIQDALGKYDGIVINPAAYTHTSVAILDALKAVRIPAVEVHISDVDAREPFRQISYAGMACAQKYAGYGFEGYKLAILWLKENVNN